MTDSPDLTRNQTLVLDKLSKTDQPMSAYTLLDELRGDGLKAPLQVYRALDKLVAQGRVHRLESISAFVACQHPDCESHAATVFMICEKCGKVSERADSGVAKALAGVAKTESFAVEKTSIELRGNCGKC
jgi:Fur family transcriptional regulator, zinc uptake regulator